MKTEQNTASQKLRRKQRARLILSVSTIVMAVLGLAAISSNLTGSAKLVSVLSDSMEPSISKGSLIVTQTTNPEHIKENDIIAFGVDSIADTRVSRIASIEAGKGVYSYTLWSDNAQMQDPWLHRTMSDMQLVVWSAPILGWIFLILSNPFFVTAMVIASVFLAHHYTMRIFEYNKRQVHARRIAEERLENIKYGGVNDIVDLFEEVGGIVVKVGRTRPTKISTVEELNLLAVRAEEERIKRIVEKMNKKVRKAETEEEVVN